MLINEIITEARSHNWRKRLLKNSIDDPYRQGKYKWRPF